MKKVSFLICGLVLLWLSACSDHVIVDPEVAEEQNYASVYIPQDVNTENKLSVFVSDIPQSINFSACYGGYHTTGKDIKVDFSVNEDLVASYNTANGKNYLPMPHGSYSLETSEAYIKAGTNNTGPIKININAAGLEVAKSYLLPLSITSVNSDVKLHPTLCNAYFVLTGSYEPGNVPCEKVYSFGNDAGGIFFSRNNDMLQYTPNGQLLLYQLNETGVYGAPSQIGPGLDVTDIMYMPDNRILTRDPVSKDICQYRFDDNYNFTSQGFIGYGWVDAVTMMPFKDLMVLAVEKDGRLRKFSIDQGGAWGDISYIGVENKNYLDYAQLFTYTWTEDNSGYLIGIDSAGNMWLTSVTDDGALGNETRIGWGWDTYKKVFSVGTDLLALDDNGDLWRYKFNPGISWPLKKQ